MLTIDPATQVEPHPLPSPATRRLQQGSTQQAKQVLAEGLPRRGSSRLTQPAPRVAPLGCVVRGLDFVATAWVACASATG